MNPEAIQKTAICWWSDDDEGFVVQSPIFTRVIGVGDTEAEAWQIFGEILEETYADYKAGRLATSRMGRPAKDKEGIHVEVNPEIRKQLKEMAGDIGISQGEAIEYLFSFWKAKHA